MHRNDPALENKRRRQHPQSTPRPIQSKHIRHMGNASQVTRQSIDNRKGMEKETDMAQAARGSGAWNLVVPGPCHAEKATDRLVCELRESGGAEI